MLQRPWELTRKDLRHLKLALDQRGLSETTLATAKGGGWPRLNRLFGGELEQVLHRFHEAVWEAA